MSGGAFDYNEFYLNEIADELKERIFRMNTEIDNGESYSREIGYEKYNIESEPILEQMINMILALRALKKVLHEFDLYFSSDISKETLFSTIESKSFVYDLEIEEEEIRNKINELLNNS